MSSASQKVLRVGTRRSALAKAQTRWVVDKLLQIHPDLNIEIVEVVTTGDKAMDTSITRMPGKGLFVKEIEEKLLAGEIDLAVHSMKDLPTEFPDGLTIGAVPERVDPRDVLVTKLGKNLEDLPNGARVGTGSLRRRAQLLHRYPDLNLVDIRGNIDTRLKKAETDDYDAIILAAAGLTRMGWDVQIQQYLSCGEMIPAVGQGALGIEIREDDETTRKLIEFLNDPATEMSVKAERHFLQRMGGGCQTPMAAFCRERDGNVAFQGFCADEDGGNFRKDTLEGTLNEAMELADQLADRLISDLKSESIA
ncbi:MAG: hydroxymethylbilane synthase [Aliifodinibius sp.]|nr:hydroxymethylbilane synthase [Fodinibius sp.]NIV14846.1 hydroxymethylbilane synthase [Fodinibius sp.]NIY28725.1 hydroxymethylbilane synthase [Fodinibius sp.]